MYDPQFDSKFNMGTTEARWWTDHGAEPVWVTARKCGLKVGMSFIFDSVDVNNCRK